MTNSDLTDADLALLDDLLAEDRNDGADRIAPHPADDGPLSYQQERLWFLHTLAPHASAYVMSSAFILQGALDVAALRTVLAGLVRRHGALRTAIRCDQNGTAHQVIGPAYLPLTDCRDWAIDPASPTFATALAEYITAERAKTRDIAQGRPLRVALAQCGQRCHVVVFCLHHLVCDAWSLALLIHETARGYDATIHRQAYTPPPLPIRYLDYAVWQRRRDVQCQADLAYWRDALKGILPVELPTDHPRPKQQTDHGAIHSFRLPAQVYAQVRTLATQMQTTDFCILMAALQVLLARQTGQWDVALGTAIAGREQVQTHGVIGFFANMVVIRTIFTPRWSFHAVVQAVTQRVRAALDHARLPFDRLVEHLQPARDLSRHPLFQRAFTLLDTPISIQRMGDVAVTRVASQEAARFDIELIIHPADGTLFGQWIYNTDLFAARSIQRLSQQWLILVADAVARPDCPIAHLALATAGRGRRAARPQPSVAPFVPVHAQFFAHARQQPTAVAVQMGTESITYGALAERACRIASHLQAIGGCAFAPVGLWFTPGFSLIAAVIATLHAGGAYVPLDPQSPPQRLATILASCRMTLILTEKTLCQTVPGAFSGRVVCVEEAYASKTAVLPRIGAEQLAYLIFTSGSTGRPKGVEVSHRQLAQLFSACREVFAFRPTDCWTFFH